MTLSYVEAVHRLVRAALTLQGAPYVWGGKGDRLWTRAGLIAHKWSGKVVDCSGLVTLALKMAGGPDWTATQSARTLREQCEREMPPNQFGTLHFYGRNGRTTHVAIALDHGLVLEAAGGDETTLEPKPGALTRVGFETRNDFQEAGRLPLERLLTP